jgi:tetratricopeptide (TPR) repeat protein
MLTTGWEQKTIFRQMTTATIEEADRAFDLGDLVRARDLYREVLRASEPTAALLSNLRTAEECEVLSTLAAMGKLHPGNEDLLFRYARALLHSRRHRQAMGVCSEALALRPTPSREFLLRKTRMEASVWHEANDEAVRELVRCEELARTLGHRGLVLSLTRFIAGLARGRFVAFVDMALAATPLGSDLSKALLAKQRELLHLQSLEAEVKQVNRERLGRME